MPGKVNRTPKPNAHEVVEVDINDDGSRTYVVNVYQGAASESYWIAYVDVDTDGVVTVTEPDNIPDSHRDYLVAEFTGEGV